MSGSLVLNHRHYAALKAHLSQTYEDSYFDEDAIYMERNSRDFRARIAAIDTNTLAVCTFLRNRSLACSAPPARCAIKTVFYPVWMTPKHYECCRVRGADGAPAGGFGGLFSRRSQRRARSSTHCHASRVTALNFTLARLYTAHYAELDCVPYMTACF